MSWFNSWGKDSSIRHFEIHYFLNAIRVTLLVSRDTSWFCIICTDCQDSPSHAVIFYKQVQYDAWWQQRSVADTQTYIMPCLDHLINELKYFFFFFLYGSFLHNLHCNCHTTFSSTVLVWTVSSSPCCPSNVYILTSERERHRRVTSSDGCTSAAYVFMYIQRDISNLCTGLIASALYWQT